MNNRYALRLFVVVMLSLVGSPIVPPSQVAAQTVPASGPGKFVPPPGWDEAMLLIKDPSTRQQGVDKLNAIAAALPKGIKQAQCLATAALFDSDKSKLVAVYQSFITDYPGTSTALQGRIGLLNRRWWTGEARGNNYILGMNQILFETGAPTLQEIVRNRGAALAKFRSLPVDIQIGLAQGYETMHQILGNSLKRYQEDLALALFGFESFGQNDGASNGYWGSSVGRVLRDIGPDPGPEDRVTTNPIIQLRSPRRHVCGRRPVISFETYSGDYLHSEPSLFSSKFLLDGVDIKPMLQTKVKIPKRLKRGQIYQLIRYRGRVSTPLTVGQHTLDITVQCAGYRGPGTPGLTRIVQKFTVDYNERDDEDEDRDDDFGELRGDD
jgi:hypothetical protein